MRDLNVTSVDAGVIVATDSDGAEYRIAVDEVTLSRLKRPHVSSAQTRVSPRDIQSQLRAGLTREEVAELTGASAEECYKFADEMLEARKAKEETGIVAVKRSSTTRRSK